MKKVMVVLLLLTMVFPSFVYAGDTTVIIQPDKVDVNNPEEVNVETDEVIVNADTVTLNIKDGARLINGTVLRNLNLIVESVAYKPTIDLSLDIANILKTDDYKFGTVARNEYLLEGDVVSTSGSTSIYDNSNTDTSIVLEKEEYLLGGDITKATENLVPKGSPSDYEYDNFEYVSTEIFDPKKLPDSENVVSYARREDAVMMVYKTLGKNQFKHTFYFNKYQIFNNPKYVEIGKSPFMELVPDVFAGITSDRYYTYVYSTRTLPNAYWANAITDNIIFEDEDRNEPISLGEFCELVYDKLDREGEPVLTEEEIEMMLVAHGRTLPLYLTDIDQIEAVKHLVARGIAETSMDFRSEYMNREDALLILSRAKDENMRLTFKNVGYTYMPEIVAKGFYPTDMPLSISPIEAGTIVVATDNFVVNNYDYFISADNVHFTSASGRIESKLYVKDNTGKSLSGVTVQSTVLFGQNYYWVRIPKNSVSVAGNEFTFEGEKSVYYTLDSISPNDSPTAILLEEGGGLYVSTKSEVGYVYSKRIPFPDVYEPGRFFDKEREAALLNSSSRTLMQYAGDTGEIREYEFFFKASDINIIKWDNKKVTEYDIPGEYPYFSEVAGNPGYYSVKIKSSVPEKTVMRYLSYDRATGSEDLVKAYVSDTGVALVSSRWLTKKGLLTGVVELVPGKIYMLYNKTDNTIIDMSTNIKRIVSGQVVTEVDKSDESPLIVKDTATGEYLIDYRAVLNFSGDYMSITDETGTVSLTIDDIPRDVLGTESIGEYRANTTKVYDLFGNGTNNAKIKYDYIIDSLGTSHSSYSVSLSDTFINSNWLIYRKRTNGLYSDSLLVFRPSTKELIPNVSMSRAAIQERKTLNEIIDLYGIQLLDHMDLAIFSLNDWIFENGAASSLRQPGENFGIIIDKNTNKYYYTPPSVNSFEDLKEVYEEYNSASVYSSTDERIKYTLPLVNYNGVIVNLNNNLFIQNGDEAELGDYPSVLVNPSLSTLSLTSSLVNGITGGGIPRGTDFILGVNSPQSLYFPYKSTMVDWNEAINSVVYFGGMKAKVTYTDGSPSGTFKLFVNNAQLMSQQVYSGQLSPFKEIFRGSSSKVLTYGMIEGFRLTDPSTNITWDSVGFTKSLVESAGQALKIDLEDMKIQQWLQFADDGLSLLNVIALAIIPRLMLFLFIAFATLSLISDNRLVRLFADKVFDPFKLISLGYTDITRVTPTNAWISVTIAIVFLAMVSTTLIQVIAWILTFFQTLLTM